MKYDITRACGCADRIDIYGTNVHGERDKKAEYESTKMCRECYLKAQAEENKAKAEANAESGMVELTGSEKQIAWAESIREKTINAITNEPAIGEEAEMVKAKAIEVGKAIIEATWWIDNRDNAVKAVIIEAVKELKAAQA